MVNVVDRSHEGREPMAHPAVDRVLKEGPGEEASGEKSDKSESFDGTNHARHINMVEPRRMPAQSGCTRDPLAPTTVVPRRCTRDCRVGDSPGGRGSHPVNWKRGGRAAGVCLT